MPFFLRGQSAKKENKFKNKKGKQNAVVDKTKRIPKRKLPRDEIVTSSDEDDEYLRDKYKKLDEYNSEEEETVQEKKARFAEEYLNELKRKRAEESDEEEEGDEENQGSINKILKDGVLESAGKLYKPLAKKLKEPDPNEFIVMRCKQHNRSITCTVVSRDESLIFSASKDASIVKWSIDGKKLGFICGKHKKPDTDSFEHSTTVHSLAISHDNKYLASGDEEGHINIWNVDTLEHIKQFKKNKSTISGLVFRLGTHTLYSCSHDKNVMVWNLEVMSFVEHLGGHATAITGIDALGKEACITSGGRDETVIIYQIVEDKQIIFNGKQNSIDGIKLINDKHFVTYGQDGSLAFYSTLKKKPHYVIKEAHGLQENNEPKWLTAVSALVNSDVVATGSSDGYVKLWKVGVDENKIITPIFSIPVAGIINSLSFTVSGSHLIVGVGQEHKLGRWFCDKSVKNSVIIIPLNKTK